MHRPTYIDFLPEHLFSRVLLQCLPIYTTPRGCAGPTWKDLRRQERDRLRLVSRRWNFVVTSTPQFWTLIDVELYWHPEGSLHLKPSCFAVIALWLYRSAQLPLDVILFIEDDGYRHLAMYQATAEVLDLLWTSVYRWRTLKLNLSETSGLFWSVLPLTKALILEAIHFSNSIPDYLIEATIRGFGNLGTLRTFSIDGLQVTASRAMIQLMPLSRLTRLDVLIQGGCLEEGLNVIRECVSATWIRVDRLGERDLIPGHAKPVELPQLKILELAGLRCDIPELLFFHCTNLQVLSISSGSTSTLGTIISEFISRRNHSLRVLRVSELVDDQLISFFGNPDIVRIPAVEVKMLNVGLDSVEQARRALEKPEIEERVRDNLKVLEDRVDCANSGPLVGWADSAILDELDDYFFHEWTTPLNAGLFHA